MTTTTNDGLLNATSQDDKLVSYDRSYGGAFDNPYGAAPRLTFFMHRVTIKDSDKSFLKADPLPSVIEAYSPGKVYQVYNPQTGAAISGSYVNAEMAYAILYSLMRAAVTGAPSVVIPPSDDPEVGGSPSLESPSSPG